MNGKKLMLERAAFEAWASENGKWPEAVLRIGASYNLLYIEERWASWQARAATEKQAPLTDDAAREIADQWYADDVTSAVELVRRTERAHGIGIDGDN